MKVMNMIESKIQLKEYLEADRQANNKTAKRPKTGGDMTWRFLIALRKYEYQLNCNHSIFRHFCVLFAKARWYYYSIKTSITIPPNVFDKGIVLYHYGNIIVNNTARGGVHITLQPGTVISEGVVLGDNVYLAPGVKIVKNISIANNTYIGFNAVVTKSIECPDGVYAGIPAYRLRNQK